MGMCFPTGTVSGIVHFDIRVLLHENKGKLIRVKGQDDFSNNFVLLKPNVTPVDGGLHTYWFGVDVDTRKMPDGLRHFRWYADLLHSNGNTQTARAQWPLDVENGTTDQNAADNGLRFLNWYQVANPARNWGYIGPVITHSGSRTLTIKCSLNGDGSSPAIDRLIVNGDPDFHNGSDGTVLYDSADTSTTVTVPSGITRVVARCQQDDGDEQHTGVGSVPAS